MILSKHLTTETTFSKILAAILFIILPFVGFWLGMEYKKLHAPKLSPKQEPQKIDTGGTLTILKTGLNFCSREIIPNCIPINEQESPISAPLYLYGINNRRVHIVGTVKIVENRSKGCELSQVGCSFKELIVENFQALDETANWKTYRNEEYGFEFEYPSLWEATETYNPQSQDLIHITDKQSWFGIIIYNNSNYYGEISTETIHSEFLGVSARRDNTSQKSEEKTIYIGNHEAKKFAYSVKIGISFDEYKDTNIVRIYIPIKNEELLVLHYDGYDLMPFDRILSTFKFIDQEEAKKDYYNIQLATSSPAQLLVITPDGKKTGFNPDTQTTLQEIPNSNYFLMKALLICGRNPFTIVIDID